jgi:hypothetical protein
LCELFLADDDLWVVDDDLCVEDECADDFFAESLEAIGAEAPAVGLVWAKAPKLTAEAMTAAMRVFMKFLVVELRWEHALGLSTQRCRRRLTPSARADHSNLLSRNHFVATHFSPAPTSAPPCSVRVDGCGRS